MTVNRAELLVAPFTTAVTLTAPNGRLGTVTVTESIAQVVTVASVVPKNTALDPCASPKDVPTPGMMVIELPDIPAAGLIHAICTDGFELTVRAMVVVADRVPEEVPVEVPWMVIVVAPVVAELLAVNVSTLLPVVGLVPNAAVTPLGIPDAVRVTGPVNPPTSVTSMVSVPPAFKSIVNEGAEGASVKLPGPEELTVRARLVDAVSAPETPTMVTTDVPMVAVEDAVRVSTLLPVVGLGANAAVTPAGRLDAANVTLPAKQFTSVGVIVSVAVLPTARARVVAEGEIVKPGAPSEATVIAMVVVAVSPPEVPEIVIVVAPTLQLDVALAVRVSTLLPVVGLVPKVAVTPLGSPDAARVTPPVNPPRSITVMVSLTLLPATMDTLDGEDVSVKLPPPVTVRAMVVVAVMLPEVPAIVTVDVSTVAALLAVNVTTLELVDEDGLNDAVTPLGNPEAEKVTAPENGLTSVIAIVSVPLLPRPIESVEDEGLRVKLPFAAPQVVPFTANDVGTALAPLHIPLNPMPL